MQAALQFFKKYPASIICYLVYTWFCYIVLRVGLEFQERLRHKKPDESGISLGGEGVTYGFMFLVILGFIFLIAMFGNILARKQNRFYMWLSALIIVQTIAVIKIG